MNQKTLILLICLFAISYSHGVHRVAQSSWNHPNFGSTTKLYLYFSLDEALPAGGVMNIELPSTMSAFVPTTCNAWALGSDLTPPATTSGFMIGVISSTTGCQFYTYAATAGTPAVYGGAVALAANTAYGVELYMSGGGALAIGSYAPIAITTRSGYDASVTTGPMIGCNPVFDMVFVIAAPLGFTTATTRVADVTTPTACVGTACNSKKTQPGDAAMYVFSLGTWSGTTTATVIPAPYNIEFSFVKTGNSAAGYVYGTWSFASTATSCTSTQFGPANSTGGLPTMSVAKPDCTYAADSAGLFVKTIKATAAADDMRPVAGAWSTWIVSFTLEVTNPTDLVDTSPVLSTRIVNPLTNYIYAQSLTDTTTVFKVVIAARDSTSFDVTGDSVARVAFGANPMTSAGHLYGAGVYSEVFCVGSAQYNNGYGSTALDTASVDTLPSNCAQITAAANVMVVYAAAAGTQPARSVNAIELAWTIPLAIPADTTSAVVTCSIDKAIVTANVQYRFFKIHQASLATDVSNGNCWYASTRDPTGDVWQREVITCTDMAKVSANDILTVAFQFEIFQTPYKAYGNAIADAAGGQAAPAAVLTTGTDATGQNKVWLLGKVDKTIKTLTCQMVITAGLKTWYTQSILIPVDGSVAVGDKKDFATYQTFISQVPADAITHTAATGQWGQATNVVATLTHTWQVEPSFSGSGDKFQAANANAQDLTIALMFYVGDAYTTISDLNWALCGGRRIPMVLSAAMNLKFYLYGAHTFSGSNTLKTEWPGYGTGTNTLNADTGSTLTWLYRFNDVAEGAASFFFGTWGTAVTDTSTDTSKGGLNVCAADGAFDTTTGMCSTTTNFANTQAEGGKVMVSAISKAGGFTAGDSASKSLQKSCVYNGDISTGFTEGDGNYNANAAATAPTGGVLGNILTSCKVAKAAYMSEKGGATAWTTGSPAAGDFYVMFAGALINTLSSTDATTGYVGTHFTGAGDAYAGANFASYHKFFYAAAYAQSSVGFMTTFRGRGGMGSTAKQGLETFFWSVKDNGTSAENTWVISTMIHTYIAPTVAAVAGDATNAKVTVSWPAWVEAVVSATSVAIDQNDGLLFFNTMKMTVTGVAYSTVFASNNAFVGTFVPRGQAFMKSTGDNQVEAVSTQSGTTCYLYGSSSGESYQCKATAAGALGNLLKTDLRIFVHGYSLGPQLDTNFLVCSVGTVTADGVVTVIPFTNTYTTDDTKVTSEFIELVEATWAWKLVIVIGSDRNMFFVGFYPTGIAITADASYVAEKAANEFFAQSSSDPVTLIATSDLTVFQLNGVTAADFKIGATGVDSLLTCTCATAATQNWLTNAIDLAQICGDPTYLMGANTGAVNAGATAVTTVAHVCLKHTQQVMVTTNIKTAQTHATPRECWYCPQVVGTAQSWVIKSFNVPVTKDRKVSGFAVQISVLAGTVNTYNSPPTFGGVILSKLDTMTQCGVSPASIQYNVKGKEVAWSFTSPTPLAGEWIVKFVGSSDTTGYFVTSNTASTTLDCAGTVLASAQAMTIDISSKSLIKFTLPAVANANIATTNLPTYAALCAGASKFTATVNNWQGTAAALAFTAGNCVVDNGEGSAVTGLTAEDAKLGAISMAAALAFDQNTAGTASDLGITQVSFLPTVATSYGRFRFQPVVGAGPKLYAAKSEFVYTFGSATFATGSVCKVTDATFATQSAVVSSCVATSSSVTVKMGADASSAAFGVEILGVTASWAQTAQAITATLSNFGTNVQSNPATQVTLAALPATQTVKPTVTLTKTYLNTMDLGTFMFTTTLKTVNGTFNSSQWAMIQFPTYYRADLGAGVLCNVNFNGTTTEPVWCELMWDYTLKVWGPIVNAQAAATAFNISVMGVDNVNPAAARDFQVGFSAMSAVVANLGQSLTIEDSECLMEFMTVTDTVVTTGWAAAKTSLKVWSYDTSSTSTRSTTKVTITFQVPTTADNTIKDVTLGYVTLHLPKMWGAVIQSTTSLTTSLKEQALTTPFAFSEIGVSKPATFSGCSVTVWMDGTTNKFVQGSNYTLEVGGIPTSQAAVPNTALIMPVISVGKQTTGALGWSSPDNWVQTTVKTFAVETGYTELQFSAMSYTVNQGTYTTGLCIMPVGTDARFNSDISFAIDGTTFVTAPASLVAKQGDLNTCADVGTASTTALSWYWVTFTATSTAKKYTPLPYLKVMVGNTKGTVTNSAEAACTLGYSSIPIKVGYSTAPFSDIIVSLNAQALGNASLSADLTSNNPSYGLTANAGSTSVTLTQAVSSGILSFTCKADLNSTVTTSLWYNITGTDAASFTLTNAAVKATGFTARGDQIPNAVVYLGKENTTSTPAITQLQAGCPEVGTAYIWFALSTATKPSASTAAAVKSLADAFQKATEAADYDKTVAHLSEQWFSVPVVTTNSPPVAADYVNAQFHTVTNKTYTAMCYCSSSTEYFYSSSSALAVTANDNGGKVTNLELTYSKYFDEAIHNTDLLTVAGALATGVMIANERVTDRWGGMSGKPSAFVPTTAFTPQTATAVTNTTNTTDNTTTAAANTTTTANTTTRLLATSYPVNLFIQPDPTALTAVDSTSWTSQVTGIQDQLSAAVTTYGAVASIAASAAAPSISEVAVVFSTDPAATSNTDGTSVSVAGAVAGDAYVYCAFQKVGTAAATTTRILANDTNTTTATTTNDTNTTATTTTAATTTTTTATVATSMLAWSDATWVSGYSFSRSTTTTAVPAFTQSFNTTAGQTYLWACQGTSLNPVAANAQFMTAYKSGSATASVPVVVGAGSLFSTIAAISFIIIAAFFY